MEDCLFCKIAAGQIPSKRIYEDDRVIAFHDIEPQAPVHFLVIPREHISGADKITEENSDIVGHIFAVIAKITKDLGCGDDFRVVNNCGTLAGQTVKHMHFHVLAKRSLAWPPG